MDIDKTLNDFSEKWTVSMGKYETGGILDTNKDNYESHIDWHDKEISKPTWEELEFRWVEIKDDPTKYWNIPYKIPKTILELKVEELELKIKENKDEIDLLKIEK